MAKRSKWKGPTIPYTYYKKLFTENNKKFTFFERNATIIPALLGKTIKIYNGKVFTLIKVTPDMLGYKLGEFSFTRFIKKRK